MALTEVEANPSMRWPFEMMSIAKRLQPFNVKNYGANHADVLN
jgi:hypothetical protein